MDSRKVAAQARDALRHHKAGKLAQARALYEAVLKKAPRHGPALHGLGMIFHGEGEHARAIELLRSAIVQRPESAIYQNNLGNALRALW